MSESVLSCQELFAALAATSLLRQQAMRVQYNPEQGRLSVSFSFGFFSDCSQHFRKAPEQLSIAYISGARTKGSAMNNTMKAAT